MQLRPLRHGIFRRRRWPLPIAALAALILLPLLG
jgi:hypothetical protein